MWHSLVKAIDIEARGAHICGLLDEAVMDEEGQRVLDSKVQLLPKALLQVRLACVIQLALSQWHSCMICQLSSLCSKLGCKDFINYPA